MDKNSKSKFSLAIEALEKEGKLSLKLRKTLNTFYQGYRCAIGEKKWTPELEEMFRMFAHFVSEQYLTPHSFEPYHQKIRSPIDYHKFSLDFLRPLIDKTASSILGQENLREVVAHLEKGDNVIFFANHQIEGDPPAITLLLEEDFKKIGDKLIFVAGERVTRDPTAIPFSMGCNLLCIYSKKYIDHPPEHKTEKQHHNKATMRLMSSLLKEGGKCIYVAPSGGRDRKGPDGKIRIAPFDPKSIEMFYLMAKKAKTPTFFYPMALSTYEIMPPPTTTQVELGETRSTQRSGIHLAVGEQIDMEHYPNSENANKLLRRKSRADYIWNLVKNDYKKFQR
ncbi:MAG: hypothetical protein KR126chlam1_00201 [Chlamydiae bacterium]|nr:hypothetical protein [Chlamydiota bacterium]